MKFEIYDGRKEFWQWDLNQKLIVNVPDCTEVHFCNKTDDCSLVCVVEEGLVSVPNILLQEARAITVFAFTKDGDEAYTKHAEMFRVLERTKPADYVYTETEVLTYKALENRLDALEDFSNELVPEIIRIHTPMIVNVTYRGGTFTGESKYIVDKTNTEIYETFGMGTPIYLNFQGSSGNYQCPLVYATETTAVFSIASHAGIRYCVLENDDFREEVAYISDSVLIDGDVPGTTVALPGVMVTQKAVYDFVTDAFGQLSTAEPYIIRYTQESANDVYLETYFTWDELAAVAKTGRKVMCRVDGGYEPANITYYDLHYIDYNNRIAEFVTHSEGGKELLILSNSTYPAFKSFAERTDATLSREDVPADAAAVGEKLDTLTAHATYKKLYDRVEITAEDVAAAGEEGIMEIAIGSADVDLSPYNNILVKVVIPADATLNTAIGLLRITWGVTASGNKRELLSPQSENLGAACKIYHNNFNSFMVEMTFADDTFLYGQVMKNGYGTSWGYAGVQNCWTEVDPNGKKSEFRYFRIADRFGKLKFPAGTYVEVYGR